MNLMNRPEVEQKDIKKWGQRKNSLRKIKIIAALAVIILLSFTIPVFSDNVYGINITIGDFDPETDVGNLGGSVTLQILFLTILIALLPSILMVMTTFTRLIIVFSFIRSGLGTQQMPPNQVLVGLALVLTMFLMNPYIQEINQTSFGPFAAGEITQEEAIDAAMEPLRRFMMQQQPGMGENVAFFAGIANVELEFDEQGVIIADSIPNSVLIPAFVLHELTIGFAIGVFFYIPFIVIDMVVASVLMAMGMMMLPPAMISLPFKVLLFVMVDGWRLIIQVMAGTFQ